MAFYGQRYNSEGHRRKIDNLKKRLRAEGWRGDDFSKFHDWLTLNYQLEKDDFSEQKLYILAKAFKPK